MCYLGSLVSAGVTQAIFSPPLSQQRYRCIAQNLRGAATVLDLGCGDGKFLEHLLMEGQSAEQGVMYTTRSSESGILSDLGLGFRRRIWH